MRSREDFDALNGGRNALQAQLVDAAIFLEVTRIALVRGSQRSRAFGQEADKIFVPGVLFVFKLLLRGLG
jgi:hypothetical protein